MIVLRLFGTADLRTPSDATAHSVLAQVKHVAFLAIAATARGSGVRRDRVIGLLWPDLDEDRARNALSKAIHSCRRTLGEDALIGRFAEEVGVNSTRWWIDTWEFEDAIGRGAYAEALALYRRGEFLEGFHVPDASALEHWVDGERDRLRRRAIEAAIALADNPASEDDVASALEHLRMISDLSPFDERILRRHLSLLDRCGDRIGAIRAFAQFAERMQRELDVSPSPETIELVDTIRERAMAPSAPNHLFQPARVAISSGREVERVAPGASAHHSWPLISQSYWRYWFATAAVCVVLSVVAWTEMHDTRAPQQHPMFALKPITIATSDSTLLPLTADLADAVTAQIVAIGRGAWLRSVDVSSMREVNADHLIEIIVDPSADSVTVRASIRRGGDGNVVLAFDAVRASRDAAHTTVPVVSDRVAGAVAALTDTLYRAWSIAGSRTPSYAAYQAFSLALESVAHFKAKQPLAPIIEQLSTATRLDSSFAAARLLLIEQSDLSPQLRTLSDSVQAVALRQRKSMGPYDAAALDNIVAIRAGDAEAALTAAQRMVSIARELPDAHFALARAQMATRRYEGAIATLAMIARTPSWLTPRSELWQWDLTAHHALGEYETGAEHFAKLVAQQPDDYFVCLWGLPDLIALGRETAVDSMMSRCAATVGRHGIGTPGKIPNRAYFDVVIPHYLAHGNRAAALRAAARVRPGFEKYTAAEPAKARDLATIDCMLGEWTTCYPPLARSTRHASETSLLYTRRLGVAAAHVGDAEAVRAALLATETTTDVNRADTLIARAMILAATGKRDTALFWLGRALQVGVPTEIMFFQQDWHHAFELLPLHGDPLFAAMLAPRKD